MKSLDGMQLRLMQKNPIVDFQTKLVAKLRWFERSCVRALCGRE